MTPKRTTNRVIKFRAWDGERMWDESLEICPADDAYGMTLGQATNPDNYGMKVLMQFTGLLDKNGKEIYEGDIVIYETLHGFSCDEEDWRSQGTKVSSPSVVEFEDGEFWPREYAQLVDDGYYSHRWFNFEVIGNIYENPELIEKGV